MFVISGALLLVASIIAAVYFLKPQATLRVTTGPGGIAAQRLVSALVKVSTAEYPRVHFELVQVNDLAASSKALEDGKVDLAIVRSDVSPPINGQTVAILRRDVVALVVPPNSSIDNVARFSGKTIGIPQSPLQDYNAQVLDTILSYYNIPTKAVDRVFLPASEIGQAVHQKRVAAILAVGSDGSRRGGRHGDRYRQSDEGRAGAACAGRGGCDQGTFSRVRIDRRSGGSL
jgi:ABC-type nitrate/sulfonate/bicarbonate transport system substrate-binding protein